MPASLSMKRACAWTCTSGTWKRAVERLDDLLGLALAQQAVVDEHARELVADRPVHEQRGDRRVDAAGERAEHALAADLRADALDLLLDHGRRRPRRRGARDLVEEVLEHGLAVRRVHDLGMELHAVQPALGVLERCHRRVLGRRDDASLRPAARRPCRDATSRRTDPPAAPRTADRRLRVQLGAAELRDVGAVDASAELEREQLRAVTDAERRDAELEERRDRAAARRRRRPTPGRRRGSARAGCGAAAPRRSSRCETSSE